jgi:hypothetical protein
MAQRKETPTPTPLPDPPPQGPAGHQPVAIVSIVLQAPFEARRPVPLCAQLAAAGIFPTSK